jgi:hypothetical protein
MPRPKPIPGKKFYMTYQEVITKRQKEAQWKLFCSRAHRQWCDCGKWLSHCNPLCLTKPPYVLFKDQGELENDSPCKTGEGDPSGGEENVNKPGRGTPPGEEVIYVPDDGEDEALDSLLLSMDQHAHYWPEVQKGFKI